MKARTGSPNRAATRVATPNAANLWAAAARYVSRYAASTEQVRRVLNRRIQRARAAGAEIDENMAGLVEQVIARLVQAGALDDQSFAQRRVESLRQRGMSRRHIAQKLAAAGIDRESGRAAVDAAMAAAGDPDGDAAELAAAIRFAQRRRLGPFGNGPHRERRQRDLAAMARAGFDMSVARRIVDAADADSIRER